MDDITNRTTALLALLSFQEEEIPSCWVLTSGNVNHLLVLHSSFFFLFPLVVSRCQSEPSKLITPVGSQPKRWEFYRFPPALLYVVCVYIYTGLTDWCQTTRANQRVVEIPPVVYSLYFCFYYFSFFSQKMVHRKISFLFPSSREKVDNSRSSSLFYLETPENITRPRVISQSLVERDTPTANNRSITD